MSKDKSDRSRDVYRAPGLNGFVAFAGTGRIRGADCRVGVYASGDVSGTRRPSGGTGVPDLAGAGPASLGASMDTKITLTVVYYVVSCNSCRWQRQLIQFTI
jgi:hypothetical protein